jgi:hypothetical protein
VDGFDSNDLVQAGVDLNAIDGTCDGTGGSPEGSCYLYAWWEVLPSPETIITNWSNDSGAEAIVNTGDQITVTLTYAGTGNWEILVKDDTTGGYFTTEVYVGVLGTSAMPGDSAEWIVEADTDPTFCEVYGEDGQCPLSGCSPDVQFSDLAASSTYTGLLYMLDMEQDFLTGSDIIVSEPSEVANWTTLLANGFSVGYTGPTFGPRNNVKTPAKSVGIPTHLPPIYN